MTWQINTILVLLIFYGILGAWLFMSVQTYLTVADVLMEKSVYYGNLLLDNSRTVYCDGLQETIFDDVPT